MTGRPLEPLVLEALDAEWAAQSGRTRALHVSPLVRETLELAVAGTPDGIFSLPAALGAGPGTPDELLERLAGVLPATADPWTERMLPRLRPAPPSALPAAPVLAALPAPAAPELKPVRSLELALIEAEAARAASALRRRRIAALWRRLRHLRSVQEA